MDVKKEIETWKESTRISNISLGDTNEIKAAMGLGAKEISSFSLRELDESLIVLTNYLIYVSYEMGRLFAMVRFLESTDDRQKLNIERVKLNIVKPVHDALKVKIDILKKIYDRKIWEARSNATGNRS